MNTGQLVIDSESECHCSCGEWSFSEMRPEDLSPDLWQHRRETMFVEHCRRRHTGGRRRIQHEELKYRIAPK